MMKFATVRRHALSLAGTTEAPHHHFGSFRVGGRIFATVPPGETLLHLFVGDADRERALAAHPDFVEALYWGGQVVGLRVALATATPAVVRSLLDRAHARQVAKLPASKRPVAANATERPGERARAADAPDAAGFEGARNLGPRSIAMLRGAGVTSLAEVRALGAVATFVKVRRAGARPSINLLWALEGAVSDLGWQQVARDHRTSLLLALETAEGR